MFAHHEEDEPAAGGYPPQPDGLGEGGLPDPRDGVLLQVGRLRSKVRPRPLLLVLHSTVGCRSDLALFCDDRKQHNYIFLGVQFQKSATKVYNSLSLVKKYNFNIVLCITTKKILFFLYLQ